jgi:thiol-disulfide isomerase/thioredoxin/uncharacterized membrane protein YphA (DoxX/SURF4 family)
MAAIVLGLRAVLAVVFITAGVGKLLDLPGSRRAVADFGVPERAARVVGLLLPVAELLIGATLILRPSARWAAIAAFLLLAAFIVGIARAMARGQQPDCHCFGQIHSAPAGRTTLIRNAVLAAFAAVVAAYGSGPAVDAWASARSAAVLVAIGAGICAVAAAAYALSVRANMQRLTRELGTARKAAALGRVGLPPGVDAPSFALKDLDNDTVTLQELCERGQPVLLMFMTPWCGPCSALVPKVVLWQQTLSERLTIAVISSGTVEQNESFEEVGLEDVLLQDGWEVADLYRINGTPTAVFVAANGKIASNPGEMEQAIEPLVRVALRHGLGASVEGSVA